MSELTERCAECGRRLSAEGLCPACLVRFAIEPAHADLPERIGNYEVLGLIAEGGMGIVYRARQLTTGRVVALKALSEGVLAEPKQRERFRREGELALELSDKHIVPILEVGEDEGELFYVMPLMVTSLSERRDVYRGNPGAAAILGVTLARAVHFGHRRGVVHRDLKPSNILLDEHEKPYVGDFGVSRRLDAPRGTTLGRVVGTPGYMSPEQSSVSEDITIAVDIWGLGALLYDLVCGTTPFPADLEPESLRRLREADPPKPRRLAPNLDADFEAILLKCLEKDPEDRYATAEQLALDLECWIDRRPPIIPRSRAWQRLVRWARRQPVLAAAVGAGACLACVLGYAYAEDAGVLESELRQEVLSANLWAARAQAGAVEAQLRIRSDWVLDLAASVGVQGPAKYALSGESRAEFEAVTQERFDSFLVLDRKGTLVMRSPPAPTHVGEDFSSRNYFSCAGALFRASKSGTCVTGAYTSGIDGALRFGVAAPVQASGVQLGVAVGTMKTDSVLGSLVVTQSIDDVVPSDTGRSVSLVALREPSKSDLVPATSGWVVLQHEGLPPGGAANVNSPVLEAMRAGRPTRGTDDAYVDPVLGGRWLAGFARVASAPWVVVVQTREDVALGPHQRLIDRLLRAAWLAIALGCLVFASSYLLAQSRKLRRRLRALGRSAPIALRRLDRS